MVLAWALQQGISVVPRAARPEHILDNARLFGGPGGHGGGPDGVLLPGGTLSDAQIAAITALDGKLPADDEPAAGTKKEIPRKGKDGREFAVAATVRNLLPSEAQLYVRLSFRSGPSFLVCNLERERERGGVAARTF